MSIAIGQVERICSYPVKSMRGEPLDAATLGWHGLDGDRRLAFRRSRDRPVRGEERRHPTISSEYRCPLRARSSIRRG
jgi:uncharacterized protein YcbX